MHKGCWTEPKKNYCDFICHTTSNTDIYTLSLHDALPIFFFGCTLHIASITTCVWFCQSPCANQLARRQPGQIFLLLRSEEHTSELQSQFHLVCRLLLEKKKNRKRLKANHTAKKVSVDIKR